MKHLAKIVILALTLSAATCFAQKADPEPVSGKTLTRNFVNRSLVYPDDDLAAGKSGKVVIAFHIDEKGKTSNISIAQTFSDEAAQTALDIFRKIEWAPASTDGIAVATDFQYEIAFNAKSYKRSLKKRIDLPLTHPADTSYKTYDYRNTDERAYPYFGDGTNMGSYITHNMNYPAEAKQREITGTVKLSFIVECDGNISNIEVTNHVGGGCDNEAIRLIEGTRWMPAVKDGKYVRTRNTQDISFNIGAHNFIDGSSY